MNALVRPTSVVLQSQINGGSIATDTSTTVMNHGGRVVTGAASTISQRGGVVSVSPASVVSPEYRASECRYSSPELS